MFLLCFPVEATRSKFLRFVSFIFSSETNNFKWLELEDTGGIFDGFNDFGSFVLLERPTHHKPIPKFVRTQAKHLSYFGNSLLLLA